MKAKEKKEATSEVASYLYDYSKPQAVPLDLEKNGKMWRLIHNLNPCSEERYIQLQNEAVKAVKRGVKKPSTDILAPQRAIWNDLVSGVEGYRPREDWKDHIHQNDAVAAITAMFHVEILPELDDLDDEPEIAADTEYYDDETPTVIKFRVLQSGVLMTLSHSFKEEAKAQMDAFIRIDTNGPDSDKLASAAEETRAEKLYRLGKQLLVDSDGYEADSEIPIWHLAATTEEFFTRQMSRLGKFSRA